MKNINVNNVIKVFTRPSKLAQHKLKHHGGSPAYQCDHPGCFKISKLGQYYNFI